MYVIYLSYVSSLQAVCLGFHSLEYQEALYYSKDFAEQSVLFWLLQKVDIQFVWFKRQIRWMQKYESFQLPVPGSVYLRIALRGNKSILGCCFTFLATLVEIQIVATNIRVLGRKSPKLFVCLDRGLLSVQYVQCVGPDYDFLWWRTIKLVLYVAVQMTSFGCATALDNLNHEKSRRVWLWAQHMKSPPQELH